MRKIQRPAYRRRCGLVAALPRVAGATAQADDFPSRPVRIVVAFPPGGPTDLVGRIVADKMTQQLGQRVYIDNKPGANGTLGGGDVAKSDPDGYSLFLTTAGAVTVSPHIMPTMPYDALRDFAPVALVTKVTEVLVVTPKLGIKTVKELVALAKGNRAPFHSLPPASARHRISPRNCSMPPPACSSCTCPIAARRRP